MADPNPYLAHLSDELAAELEHTADVICMLKAEAVAPDARRAYVLGALVGLAHKLGVGPIGRATGSFVPEAAAGEGSYAAKGEAP